MANDDGLTTSSVGTPVSPVVTTPGTPIKPTTGTSGNGGSNGGSQQSGDVTIQSAEGMRTVIAALRKIESTTIPGVVKTGEAAQAAVKKAATSPDTGDVAAIHTGVVDSFNTGVSNVHANLTTVGTSAGTLADQLENVLNQLTHKDESTAHAVTGVQT